MLMQRRAKFRAETVRIVLINLMMGVENVFLFERTRWHTETMCMIYCFPLLSLPIAVSQLVILQFSMFLLALQFVQAKPRVLGNLSASFSVSTPSPAYPVLLGFSYICTLSSYRGRRCCLPCSHASQTGPRWILANKHLQAKDTKEVD